MNRARAGFTLLEAIVAVAIGTAFLASLAVFVSNLGDARGRLVALSARIDAAESIFTLCEQALATAVVGPEGDAGIAGDASRLRVRFAAVGLDEADGGVLGGMRAAEIAFDEGSGRVSIRRGSRTSTLEVPVRAMRVRYLGADGWLDDDDSGASGRFPVAIEVALWFGRTQAAEADPSAGVDGSDGAEPFVADVLPDGAPDRRRLFRIAGAPRVDPLAARGIREEEGW